MALLALAAMGIGASANGQQGRALLPEPSLALTTETSNSIAEAMDIVTQFHSDVTRIKRTGSPLTEGQIAYERMAGKMTVPNQLNHLPFPDENSEREWTVDAIRVAKGIKPRINYQVVNGDTAIYFQGTTEIQKNLQDNVRMIAWYRDQIEKVCPEEKAATGTYALARVIDAFLDRLAHSVPEVKVRMSGTMNVAQDQKIEFSHRELWEMLSTVNRYFFYKVQIHEDEKNEYYPADFLLMGSLVRTAAIYGADPPPDGLAKIGTRLSPDATDWRSDAFDALNSWVEEQKGKQRYPQQLCTIKIPDPKVEALPAAPAPAPGAFPADVEDVKELGGQIFIKRNGYWSLWNK
jgi:hypothetical protein